MAPHDPPALITNHKFAYDHRDDVVGALRVAAPNPHAQDALDLAADDAEDESQPTQEPTQEAHASQIPIVESKDAHLWGFLQPCSPEVSRIDFWRIQHTYTVGRNASQDPKHRNDIVLPGFKVSNHHCKIAWDGKEDETSSVVIQDMSSNGTWLNNNKIGKGNSGILRDGNEVAFGYHLPQHSNRREDYRFIFRFTAIPPKSGLSAEYDLSTELGKGSFATVMKAVHRKTGEWYAVKMIHKSRLMRSNNNDSVITNFYREIGILGSLDHPNICKLKEVFKGDDNLNLVLELVEGGDLLEYIVKRSGLDEQEARHVSYQMCDALAYIHGKGIAHRDLKPENVLLTKDSPPNVKIADFGLAKVVDSMTALRTMCGTPSYLAPEVVNQTGPEGYDHAVDSWSVGVIVYSMITNCSPFIEDSTLHISERIRRRTIDWGVLRQTGVSVQAEDFVRRLLITDPLLRMTPNEALQHPWLQSYLRTQNGIEDEPPSSTTTITNGSGVSIDTLLDADMPAAAIESVGELKGAGTGLENMQLDRDMPLPPPPPSFGLSLSDDDAGDEESQSQERYSQAYNNRRGKGNGNGNGNGNRRQSSRLIRRADVVGASETDDGPPLPEPSQEMISAYEATGNSGGGKKKRGGSRAASPEKGHKRSSSTPSRKRKVQQLHSELTPLPEEEDASGSGADGSGNGEDVMDMDRGVSFDRDALPTTMAAKNGGRQARTKSRSAAPTTRSTRRAAAAASADENDNGSSEEFKPRRSSRMTPQKMARRA